MESLLSMERLNGLNIFKSVNVRLVLILFTQSLVFCLLVYLIVVSDYMLVNTVMSGERREGGGRGRMGRV